MLHNMESLDQHFALNSFVDGPIPSNADAKVNCLTSSTRRGSYRHNRNFKFDTEQACMAIVEVGHATTFP